MYLIHRQMYVPADFKHAIVKPLLNKIYAG